MSRCFTDPGKAEESFQILDQLKDANVWRILTVLLDPSSNSIRASSSRVRRIPSFGYNVGFSFVLSTDILKPLKC